MTKASLIGKQIWWYLTNIDVRGSDNIQLGPRFPSSYLLESVLHLGFQLCLLITLFINSFVHSFVLQTLIEDQLKYTHTETMNPVHVRNLMIKKIGPVLKKQRY